MGPNINMCFTIIVVCTRFLQETCPQRSGKGFGGMYFGVNGAKRLKERFQDGLGEWRNLAPH